MHDHPAYRVLLALTVLVAVSDEQARPLIAQASLRFVDSLDR